MQIISWAVTLLTARFLAPADYGLLALVETFLPYVSLFVSLNLGTWIVRRPGLSPQEAADAPDAADGVSGSADGVGDAVGSVGDALSG